MVTRRLSNIENNNFKWKNKCPRTFLISADREESWIPWKLTLMFEQTFFSPTVEDSRSASQVTSKIRSSSTYKKDPWTMDGMIKFSQKSLCPGWLIELDRQKYNRQRLKERNEKMVWYTCLLYYILYEGRTTQNLFCPDRKYKNLGHWTERLKSVVLWTTT